MFVTLWVAQHTENDAVSCVGLYNYIHFNNYWTHNGDVLLEKKSLYIQIYIHTHMHTYTHIHTYIHTSQKVSLQSWSLEGGGGECLGSILTLTFGTTRTSQLSATHAGRNLPLRKFLDTHFCYRLSGPQNYWKWIERISQLKISNDPAGHQNRNLCLLTQCLNYLRYRLSFVTNNKTTYANTFTVKHNSPNN